MFDPDNLPEPVLGHSDIRHLTRTADGGWLINAENSAVAPDDGVHVLNVAPEFTGATAWPVTTSSLVMSGTRRVVQDPKKAKKKRKAQWKARRKNR